MRPDDDARLRHLIEAAEKAVGYVETRVGKQSTTAEFEPAALLMYDVETGCTT